MFLDVPIRTGTHNSVCVCVCVCVCMYMCVNFIIMKGTQGYAKGFKVKKGKGEMM